MNWNANDLNKEWKRFTQHCQFTFGGPLSDKTEKAKVNYLMTYIGDKGREVYGTFEFAPAAACRRSSSGTRHASRCIRQRTSHTFNENQPMHRNRNFLKVKFNENL